MSLPAAVALAAVFAAGTLADPPPPPGATDSPPKTIKAQCPVCKGSGLMDRMGCARCQGDGFAGVDPCPTCGGSRQVPYKCPTCKGSGKLAVGKTERDCPSCRGKGAPPCPFCKGKGEIERLNPAAHNGPTETCARCRGSGFEAHARCIRCASGKINLTSWEDDAGQGGTVIVGPGGAVVPGAGRRTNMTTRQETCPFCGGTREGQPVCRRCQGRGYAGPRGGEYPCLGCFGRQVLHVPCSGCGGRGWNPAARR